MPIFNITHLFDGIMVSLLSSSWVEVVWTFSGGWDKH